MPVAAYATLRGTVYAGQVTPGALVTAMDPTGQEGHLEGDVSRGSIASVDGISIQYSYRVKLGGEWIPREHLHGSFEVEEGIDSHTALFSFGLAGQEYSVAATARTWTHAPVEVWVTTGRPGALRERCRAAGVVLTCEQPDSREPVVRVSCADDAALYDRWELCYEVAPGAGLTRGEICAEAAIDAGIPAWDIPPGAVYQRPVVASSKGLFDFLRSFGEPEGWSWRFRPEDRVLEAYSVRLRQEPEPPDHVWQLGDVAGVDTTPPRDVPSRWVMRGTAVVSTDEDGGTTRTTRTVVEGLYAPKVCAEMLHPDGSVVPTSAAEQPEAVRVVSILEDEVRESGGRTVQQTTREWGWYNPAAARLRTPGVGESAGPIEGLYGCQAFIDPDGELRAWAREAFVQIGERRQTPTYDAAGTPVRIHTTKHAWYRRAQAVRNVGSEAANVVGTGVGADDQSYLVWDVTLSSVNRIEGYGLATADDVRYEHDPVTGAARREIQESWGWASPRTAIEGVPWYLLYSGTGQQHQLAPWSLRGRQETLNLLDPVDGHLLGKIESEFGYGVSKRVSGPYDWGDFRSNRSVEVFALRKRTSTQYNVLSEDAYEEIVEDDDGRRTPKLITGRAPLARFASSAWTALRQQPLETVLDDATVEAWWGFARRVIDHEYLQSLAEARDLVARLRSRALAHQHRVTRPVTLARPGQTVLLDDPRSGTYGRCLVTQLRETWQLASPTSVMATYTLEQPL